VNVPAVSFEAKIDGLHSLATAGMRTR
jgi:hypothetical protein